MYTFLLISVISLSKGILKAKIKNQARFFFVCVARYKLVAGKPAFLHDTSEVNRTIKRCLFITQTSDRIYVIFCPILPIILQYFHRIILQLQIALIQFKVIKARISLALAQQLIKMKTT